MRKETFEEIKTKKVKTFPRDDDGSQWKVSWVNAVAQKTIKKID